MQSKILDGNMVNNNSQEQLTSTCTFFIGMRGGGEASNNARWTFDTTLPFSHCINELGLCCNKEWSKSGFNPPTDTTVNLCQWPGHSAPLTISKSHFNLINWQKSHMSQSQDEISHPHKSSLFSVPYLYPVFRRLF